MFALQVYRSPVRYAAARAVAHHAPGALSAGLAPLRLVKRPPPVRPGPEWVRVRPRLAGICGSDLALLSGDVSLYFSKLVSFPFTPGHEVVGEVLDTTTGGLSAGQRVVLDPALTCAARGVLPCSACVSGARQRCSNVAAGKLSPGMQTGYCADTGGGWSGLLLAHPSQLHPVAPELTDRAAMLIEPFACATHAVERGLAGRPAGPNQTALVTGAGPLGLLTILALRLRDWSGRILSVARHPAQRERALAFGATHAVAPDAGVSTARRLVGAQLLDAEHGAPFLLGGVDVAFECAGSASSLELALRVTRAGGRVVLGGMPARGADLAPAWFRELEVIGAYAASAGLDRALDWSSMAEVASKLDSLVTATYALNRWRDAIDHALDAGRLGAARIAFQPEL